MTAAQTKRAVAVTTTLSMDALPGAPMSNHSKDMTMDTFITPTSGSATLTMSSRDISDLCGKKHQHVLRDIRAYVGAVLQMERGIDVRSLDWNGEEGLKVFGQTPIGGVSCSLEMNPQNGQQYPVYHLDQAASITVVAGYNVLVRKKVVDRWLELERRAVDPMVALNDPATLRHLLLQNAERVLSLESVLAVVQPKADALERLTHADGTFCITDAAKALHLQPKSLFAWLSANHWTYRRAGNAHWVGHQDKLRSGMLWHRVEEVSRMDGTTKITEQVRVTAKGLARLAELLGEGGAK